MPKRYHRPRSIGDFRGGLSLVPIQDYNGDRSNTGQRSSTQPRRVSFYQAWKSRKFVQFPNYTSLILEEMFFSWLRLKLSLDTDISPATWLLTLSLILHLVIQIRILGRIPAPFLSY